MYDDDEPINPNEVRHTLRRVAAYREVCERVRKGSTGALIFGAIMLAIWWFLLPEKTKYVWFGIIYLTLACLEFGSGILNRLFPSAEGVLLAAVVLTCFGLWNIARVVLIWQKMMPGVISPIFAILGVMWTVQGSAKLWATSNCAGNSPIDRTDPRSAGSTICSAKSNFPTRKSIRKRCSSTHNRHSPANYSATRRS